MKKYIACSIIGICILRFLTFIPVFHDFIREPYIFEKEHNSIAYADYERFSPGDYSYKIKLNGRNLFSKPIGYVVNFTSETLGELTVIIDCDMQCKTEFRDEKVEEMLMNVGYSGLKFNVETLYDNNNPAYYLCISSLKDTRQSKKHLSYQFWFS